MIRSHMIQTVALVVAILSLFALITLGEDKSKVTLKRVQKGEVTLYCHIGSEYRSIEPSKVMDFVEGTWVFTNGGASNCFIERGK